MFLSLSSQQLFGQQHNHDNHDGHDHSTHDHSTHDHGSHNSATKDAKAHADDGHHAPDCAHIESHEWIEGDEYDPAPTAFHHVGDANVYSIGPLQIPLPCMLYAKDTKKFDFFLSNKFGFKSIGHGDGKYAYNKYVLDGGTVKRIKDLSFPDGKVAINGIVHEHDTHKAYVCAEGKMWETHKKSTADFGIFGGDVDSNFFDFSITKNVMSMLIVFLLMAWMFFAIARAYRNRRGEAPRGLQGFIEPIFLFIQDEVCKPFLGDKYMRYQPFIMSLFFFILGLNLWGQVPFLGGSNVTGNLAFTAVLALFAFFVTTFSGNKHYWEHIFWMPGVPAWVKTILTPVELLGVFIKPITLALRLFANITAGHMVIIIFVSLIFMFGKLGGNPTAGYLTSIGSGLLSIFIMAIELLVAFIQAFVFAILTASYIGAAVEDHHHEGDHSHDVEEAH